MQLGMGMMGFGRILTDLVKEPMVKGFTFGAALAIIKTQLGALGVARSDGVLDWPTVGLSAASLIVLELARWVPHVVLAKMGSLVVMAVGLGVAGWVDVETVGDIPRGLPDLGHAVFADWTMIREHVPRLVLFSIPIALVGFAEAFTIAQSGRSKELPPLDPNRELVALGMANVWTFALGGYPVTGSFSRSAVNAECGATSCVSSFSAAALVAVALLFFTDVLSALPKASVACVVVSAVLRLFDLKYVRELYFPQQQHVLGGENAQILDRVMFAIVFLVGITLGVEYGLAVGFAISAFQKLSG